MRKEIKKIFFPILDFLVKIASTFKTILLVCFFSKKQIKFAQRNKQNCIIIGNGPTALDFKEVSDLNNYDVFVTNDFANSNIFPVIRPLCYFLIDPFFFKENKRTKNIFTNINKVNWKMNLCIPFGYGNSIKKIVSNSKINIIEINTVPTSGFKSLSYFLIDSGLATPKAQNVLVSSLISAIQMKYNVVELFGVEHDWSKYMVLDQNNILHLESHHFYDHKKNIKIWAKPNGSPWKVAESFKALSKMFYSYDFIAKYSDKKNVKIINRTKNSLIDAFPRGTI